MQVFTQSIVGRVDLVSLAQELQGAWLMEMRYPTVLQRTDKFGTVTIKIMVDLKSRHVKISG
jgi:hypothetical protein